MATTSRWGTVVVALATQMRALTDYRDPDTRGNEIPVFIGTEVGLTDQTAGSWLAIAWSGDPDSPEEAGEWDQEPAAHAASGRPRDESGEIRYRVQVSRGDRDVVAAMNGCFTVLADLEECVRDDPYLGLGAGANVWHVQVVSGTPRLLLDQGTLCVIEGRLRYQGRI